MQISSKSANYNYIHTNILRTFQLYFIINIDNFSAIADSPQTSQVHLPPATCGWQSNYQQRRAKWVRVHPARPPWCLLVVYESFGQSCNGTTNWLVIQNANSANARRSCVGVSRRMRLFPFLPFLSKRGRELGKFQVIYMNFICNCINLNYKALEGAPNSSRASLSLRSACLPAPYAV